MESKVQIVFDINFQFDYGFRIDVQTLWKVCIAWNIFNPRLYLEESNISDPQCRFDTAFFKARIFHKDAIHNFFFHTQSESLFSLKCIEIKFIKNGRVIHKLWSLKYESYFRKERFFGLFRFVTHVGQKT